MQFVRPYYMLPYGLTRLSINKYQLYDIHDKMHINIYRNNYIIDKIANEYYVNGTCTFFKESCIEQEMKIPQCHEFNFTDIWEIGRAKNSDYHVLYVSVGKKLLPITLAESEDKTFIKNEVNHWKKFLTHINS